jgi:hypothetical protein
MSFNLRNRSLLTVQDYTPREFRTCSTSRAISSAPSTPAPSRNI